MKNICSDTPRLKFKGHEYILINGHGGRNEGAIATQEQYENFEQSYAHLFKDGTIMRYQQQIGKIEDIEWLD